MAWDDYSDGDYDSESGVVIFVKRDNLGLGLQHGTMVWTEDSGQTWKNPTGNEFAFLYLCGLCAGTLAYYGWKGCGWSSVGYLANGNYINLTGCVETGYAMDQYSGWDDNMDF